MWYCVNIILISKTVLVFYINIFNLLNNFTKKEFKLENILALLLSYVKR